MKKQSTINVAGKAYPCYMTMGALRRFKRVAGHDFGQGAAPESVTDMLTFCHCMTAAACNAEGTSLDMDADTFADKLSPEEFAAWCDSLSEGDGAPVGEEKKSA